MKKGVILSVCCFLSFCVLAQTAQRDEKGMKKLISKSPGTSVLYKGFQSDKTKYKEVSLRDVAASELNDIEKKLLEQFSNVVVCGYIPRGYFVCDASDNIGLCDLSGQLIVPPLEGYFSNTSSNFHLGGAEDMNDYVKGLTNSAINSLDKVASPFGSFQVVIDRKTLKPVIPYGKYDDIKGLFKGVTIWYFVGRMNEQNEMRWGVCDNNGNEVLPVVYKGIYRDGSRFVGTDEYTLEESEAMARERADLIIARRQERAAKFDKWINALETTGTLLNTAAETVAAVQNKADGAGASEESDVSGAGTNHSNGEVHPGMSQSELQSRYNAAIENIRKIKDSWAGQVGTHGEVALESNLRSVKQNIKRIKDAAAAHGITIRTNSLETWSPR